MYDRPWMAVTGGVLMNIFIFFSSIQITVVLLIKIVSSVDIFI